MTIARLRVVDPPTARRYGGVTRCVRVTLLRDVGNHNRNDRTAKRQEVPAEMFAVPLVGLSVTDQIG